MKKLCLALFLLAPAAHAEPFSFSYANWSDHALVRIEAYKIRANGKKAKKPFVASSHSFPGHSEPVFELPGFRCGKVEVDVVFDDGTKMNTQADLCASAQVHISY